MYLHVKVPVPAKANALKEINAKIKAAVAKQPWRACERASEQAKNFTFAVNGAEAALQASLSFEYTNPPLPPLLSNSVILNHLPFAIRPQPGLQSARTTTITTCLLTAYKYMHTLVYTRTHTHTVVATVARCLTLC